MPHGKTRVTLTGDGKANGLHANGQVLTGQSALAVPTAKTANSLAVLPPIPAGAVRNRTMLVSIPSFNLSGLYTVSDETDALNQLFQDKGIVGSNALVLIQEAG